MREIKFRGKRIDNGEWVFGDVIGVDCSYVIAQNMFEWVENSGLQGGDWWHVIPATVGQFTGLRDKNSKEIYGGDIISCGDGNVPTLIKWHKESHAYYAYNIKRKEHYRLDKFFMRYIGEVIGNIWDNRDLLE